MSAKKKNTGLITIIVVALLAVGGIGVYLSQNKGEDIAASAPVEVTTAAGEDTREDTTKDTGNNAKAEPAPAPAGLAEGEFQVEAGNPVVARVGGKDIFRQDVYRFIQTMPAQMQQLPATQVYPAALEQVINTQIVQNKADNAGIESTDIYKQELEITKQQIARNLYLQQQVNSKITDAMLKNAYKEYSKKIPDVTERRARHILVETEDKGKAVIEKLKTDVKFEDLAKELSVGPTATKGGDLGYFAQNEMVPEFAKAAFALKKGAVSKAPVKTQFGWHVIKVLDERQRPKPTLAQMTPVLRAELQRNALDELLKNWRDGAKVEQFDINGKPLRDGANAIGLVPADTAPAAQPKQDG